jgi:hypothetical protein
LEETLLGDLNSFQARFVALHQSIIDDGIKQGVPFCDKDLKSLAERLKAEGSSFGKVTLPLLGKALDSGLVGGRFTPIPHFATKRDTCLPTFCHPVFRKIFGTDGYLLADPCVTSIYFLRQLLLVDGKLICEPNAQQKELAVQGFIDRQSSLRKVRVPVGHPVLERARWLLGRVLRHLDLSDINPGHGPGVVHEGKDRFERWDFTSWPKKAEKYYPYGVYGAHSFQMASRSGKGIPLTRHSFTKCCLVPKDFKGPRLISAESSVTQYLQQGQMKKLMQYIDKHPVLSRSIRLRDQTLNQRRAKTAVADAACTLDLSNASDTVSVVLFWYLFAEVPVLRAQLMSTRSDYMFYRGSSPREHRLVKLVAFAPMGSAVCFPVETLIFWALTMASLMLVRPRLEKKPHLRPYGRRFVPFQSSVSEMASEICVFGDDIIAPLDCVSTLTTTLTSVGCQVNASKTCYMTPFRESCGSEWFNQSDVTIIRNRRYNYEADLNIKDYPVLCGLQRKFFLRGLFSTAELVKRWVSELGPTCTISIQHYRATYLADRGSKSLPGLGRPDCLDQRRSLRSARIVHFEGIFEDNRIGNTPHYDPDYFTRNGFPVDTFPGLLGWADAVDSAMPLRWNRGYQRMEFRCPIEYQNCRAWSTEGYPRLMARLLSDSADRIAIRDRKVKMAWSYLPFNTSLSGRINS